MKGFFFQTPGTYLQSTSLLLLPAFLKSCWSQQTTLTHWDPSGGPSWGQTPTPGGLLHGINPLSLSCLNWKMVLIMVSVLSGCGKGVS